MPPCSLGSSAEPSRRRNNFNKDKQGVGPSTHGRAHEHDPGISFEEVAREVATRIRLTETGPTTLVGPSILVRKQTQMSYAREETMGQYNRRAPQEERGRTCTTAL